MFTGIVEELGEVSELISLNQAARLTVYGPLATSDARPGDSISVNGVCLTVVEVANGNFVADVMAETLSRSSLQSLTVGSKVNLERAARLGDRLGGHLVQGHVDAVGEVVERLPSEHWEVVRISLPTGFARYIVEKGSITVDGVSLTVTEISDSHFAVSLIPETLKRTVLGEKKPGELVNLEIDVIAKYVEKLVAPHAPRQ
ncbi:MAG: riboflavin synthase [Corynebacteriales bacterium]|nr:riboflavin synthase [Mycobacteriales bacterium]